MQSQAVNLTAENQVISCNFIGKHKFRSCFNPRKVLGIVFQVLIKNFSHRSGRVLVGPPRKGMTQTSVNQGQSNVVTTSIIEHTTNGTPTLKPIRSSSIVEVEAIFQVARTNLSSPLE